MEQNNVCRFIQILLRGSGFVALTSLFFGDGSFAADGSFLRLGQRPTSVDQTGGYGPMVVSIDGSLIVTGSSTQLLPGTPLSELQVVLIDRLTGVIELISRTPAGGFQNKGVNPPIGISRDNRWILFSSRATNIDPSAGDPDRSYVFLHDRSKGTVKAISGILDGVRFLPRVGILSPTGDFAIAACAPALPEPRPWLAVCRIDLATGAASVVFRRQEQMRSLSYPKIDPTGNFYSIALADQDEITGQVYLVNLTTLEESVVSTASDGTPSNFRSGDEISLSRNAEYIAFSSFATNLVPGLVSSPVKLMYVKHRPSNTIRMVSFGRAVAPNLSDDGLRLLYLDYGYRELLTVYDWVTNARREVARPASGPANGLIPGTDFLFGDIRNNLDQLAALSPDGRTLIFPSTSTNYLEDDDLPQTVDLFARRLAPVPSLANAVTVPSGGVWTVGLALLLLSAGVFWLKRR